MDDTGNTSRAFTEALGNEIVYWRKRRRMSREQLAEAADISLSTMGRIERDGPKDVSDTWRIAEALGLPLQDMIRRAEEVVTLDRQARTMNRLSDHLGLNDEVDEADQAVRRLDEHTRSTRPTRKREMQQLDDQAARDEDRA